MPDALDFYFTLPCRQLIQDQLPERKNQLYNIYGFGGPKAMIPTTQPSEPKLAFGKSDVSSGAGQYLSIANPNTFAVDISGYKLQGDATLTLQSGRLRSLPRRSAQRIALQ